MKEELRRFWLINRKLLSILIYYGIINLLLFCIEGTRRWIYSHNLVNWVFSLKSIPNTYRIIVSTKEQRPIVVTVKISVAQTFRNIHLRKIVLGSSVCKNLKVSQWIVIIQILITSIIRVRVRVRVQVHLRA